MLKALRDSPHGWFRFVKVKVIVVQLIPDSGWPMAV